MTFRHHRRLRLNAGEKVSEPAARLINSGSRMKGLLDELVEFNRANLGLGLHSSPADVDLADLSRTNFRSCARRIPAVSCCWT
jgi:hypothetical protein